MGGGYVAYDTESTSQLKGTVMFYLLQIIARSVISKTDGNIDFYVNSDNFLNSLPAKLNVSTSQIWPMATGLPPLILQHYITVLCLISIYIYFLPQDCVCVSLAPNSDWHRVGASQTSINVCGRVERREGEEANWVQQFVDGSSYSHCFGHGMDGTRKPETIYC